MHIVIWPLSYNWSPSAAVAMASVCTYTDFGEIYDKWNLKTLSVNGVLMVYSIWANTFSWMFDCCCYNQCWIFLIINYSFDLLKVSYMQACHMQCLFLRFVLSVMNTILENVIAKNILIFDTGCLFCLISDPQTFLLCLTTTVVLSLFRFGH